MTYLVLPEDKAKANKLFKKITQLEKELEETKEELKEIIKPKED